MNNKFTNIQKQLNCIPGINTGGCGVSAYIMSSWALKFLNKKLDIILLYNSISTTEYLLNKKLLNDYGDKAYCPDHIVLFDGKKYFDSSGDYDIKNYRWKQTVDLNFLCKIINDGHWNNSFKIKLNKYFINNLINKV